MIKLMLILGQVRLSKGWLCPEGNIFFLFNMLILGKDRNEPQGLLEIKESYYYFSNIIGGSCMVSK